ncbi:excisionase [Halomonas sp. 1513]|nr:excisionase [Halomonas sp. 1513]
MAQNKWVLRNKLSELYGYSLSAIDHKRKDGTWPEGRIWRKAPDGRIFYNVEALDRWVESGPGPR